ncbi:MAG: hypothetical protein IJ727_06365 [Treponema sp.]|jgi:hypothetical protein|nr:hypothetical protein [Treponema sp.]
MKWQPFETIYSAISDEDFDFVFSVKFSDGTIKNLELETILEWDNGASSEYGNKDIVSWKKTKKRI